MEKPLLSVIIPIYNVENYLKRCLDTVVNQTYKNLEIICVDDGSVDNSGNIADEYAKKDSRIKVIHKDNGGLVSARKVGIKAARGMYAVPMDSDDYIELNMYEDLMQLILEYDADVVTSGLIRDYGSHIVEEYERIPAGFYHGDELLREVLCKIVDTGSFYQPNITLNMINKIYKLEQYRQFQLAVDDMINVGEDGAFLLPYFMSVSKLVISGKNYYHYCIRNDSTMGTKNANDLESLQALSYHLMSAVEKIGEKNNFVQQCLFFKVYAYMLRNVGMVLKIHDNMLYPFGSINKNYRILLYGAGRFGIEMKSFLSASGFNVVAWCDKNSNMAGVTSLDDIGKYKFDVVLVAVLLATVVDEIKAELKRMGIDEKKIICVDINMMKYCFKNEVGSTW